MSSGQTVLEKLDGGNYPTWRFKVMTYLKAKSLWSAVSDPPLPADAGDAERADWDKRNLEALNTIVQALTTSQTSYVINKTTAKEAWEKLEQVNRGRMLEKKLSLKRDLNAIRWKKVKPQRPTCNE